MKTLVTITLALGALLVPTALRAAEATTIPQGFVKNTVLANSDATFAVAIDREAVFTGTIASINGSTLTVDATPGWTANQFVYVQGSQSDTYYALITSGPKEGLRLTITANGTNTVTVNTSGAEDLTDVEPGDALKIAPYWTLGTLIPPDASIPNGTLFLLYNPYNQSGVNFSPSSYQFYTDYGWYKGATNSNDLVLFPGSSYGIRNVTGSSIEIVQSGVVQTTASRIVLTSPVANKEQDIRFSINSPVPIKLGESGLGEAGDRLLIYDNARTGVNKSPSSLVYYEGAGWYKSVTPASDYLLQPGVGYVIRKAAAPQAENVIWTSELPYDLD